MKTSQSISVLVILAGLAVGCTAPKDEDTALHQAATSGNATEVKRALSRGAKVDSANDDGWTPLLEASGSGYTDVVTVLLENKANVNYVAPRNQFTALHAAAQFHRPEIVKILLSKGANVSAKDSKGRTPLDYALAVHRLPSGKNNPEVNAVLSLLESTGSKSAK
jgi:ankyrin repeat protein